MCRPGDNSLIANQSLGVGNYVVAEPSLIDWPEHSLAEVGSLISSESSIRLPISGVRKS
jgi:hypothetical protein